MNIKPSELELLLRDFMAGTMTGNIQQTYGDHDEGTELRKKTWDKFKQQLETKLNAIVGDDEIQVNMHPDNQDKRLDGRNQLRAELRKQLKEFIWGKE